MGRSGNPGCVTGMDIDFGPIVPLDYDGNSSLEHGFIITSGSTGSVAPSAISQDGNLLTFAFSPPVCGGFSGGSAESTFFFGLASPFGAQAVTAVVRHNTGDPLDLEARVRGVPS